jgi:hypothetical protein
MSQLQQEKPQQKPVFVVPEDTPLPGALSDIQKVVLSLVLLFALSGIGYRIFFRGTIDLVSPANLGALAAKDLEFSWKCNRSNVSFVVEVYDETELIMRQITEENSYTPDTDQKLEFAANRSYRWRVIPNPDVKQRYSLDTEFQVFYITKALPPRPEPEQTQTEPAKTEPTKSEPAKTEKTPGKSKTSPAKPSQRPTTWPRDPYD